ncbi:MAG: sigma factor-like helix-turn-helix DNA-binding protein, partial [Bacteroidota bacterium]
RKIMINECLMFLRKRINFKLISIDGASQIEARIEPNNSFELKDYLKLINDLPIGYRTVFNLHAIEGYKHNEIAEILNISESTSRSQLTKARKLLKQRINKNGIIYA